MMYTKHMPTLQKPTKSPLTKTPQIRLSKLVNYKRDSTYVISELKDILASAQADKQMITKIQLFDSKEYSRHQFQNWVRRYPTVNRIQELGKKIEEVLESHLIYAGMSKNPAFPIFLLKNHYGYQDKREVETETTHVFKVTRGPQTPVKLAKRVVIDVAPNKEQ